MTFSGLGAGQVVMPTYTENGITATSIDGTFWGFPTGGQLHLDPGGFSDSTYDFTFGGNPFSLNSLDVSFASTGALGNLTAFDAANNVLGTTSFSGTSIGTVNVTGLSGFSSISRLRLVDTVSHFSIDNLVLTQSASAAVPEPSTWLTMIIGFGLLAGYVRGQRRAPSQVRYV
jgi:hypothetical protein